MKVRQFIYRIIEKWRMENHIYCRHCEQWIRLTSKKLPWEHTQSILMHLCDNFKILAYRCAICDARLATLSQISHHFRRVHQTTVRGNYTEELEDYASDLKKLATQYFDWEEGTNPPQLTADGPFLVPIKPKEDKLGIKKRRAKARAEARAKVRKAKMEARLEKITKQDKSRQKKDQPIRQNEDQIAIKAAKAKAKTEARLAKLTKQDKSRLDALAYGHSLIKKFSNGSTKMKCQQCDQSPVIAANSGTAPGSINPRPMATFLFNHVISHLDEAVYSCWLCDVTPANRTNIRNHVTLQHPTIEPNDFIDRTDELKDKIFEMMKKCFDKDYASTTTGDVASG